MKPLSRTLPSEPGRKSRPWNMLARAGAAVAMLVCFSAALADHKPGHTPGGGDGGGGNNGGGVIYFSYQGDLYTMNDDGSGIAQVNGFPDGYAAWGDPSRRLHAGKRWFAQVKEILDEFYPDFHPNGTVKDFAYRKKLVVLSDGGDERLLEIADDLEPLETPNWVPGDTRLSWAGRRWGIDPANPDEYGRVLEGGLYVTPLDYDPDGHIVGIDGPSSCLVELPLVASNAYRQSNDSTPGPDMYGHDWAPDGERFVFDDVSGEGIWTADTAGNFELLFDDPLADYVGAALWSPAGDRLMFQYDPDIGHTRVMLINPDSSGLHMLVRSSPNWTRTMGAWSPTGSHLLYQHWDHFFDDSYIIRATAAGSDKKRITDKGLGAGYSTPRVIGWRATD